MEIYTLSPYIWCQGPYVAHYFAVYQSSRNGLSASLTETQTTNPWFKVNRVWHHLLLALHFVAIAAASRWLDQDIRLRGNDVGVKHDIVLKLIQDPTSKNVTTTQRNKKSV